MRKISSLLILTVLPLLSCSRQADNKPLPDAANIVVTPNLQDTQLPLGPRTSSNPPVKPALAFANQALSTAQYFRLVDDLRALARVDGDDSLGALAAGMYRGFYANPANVTHTTFLRGPIPSAMVGEGEGPIRDAVISTEKDLHGAVKSLGDLLASSAHTYPWPKALPRFAQGLDVTDRYAEWLVGEVQKLAISGSLKAAAEQQLKAQYAKFRPSLVAMAEGLDGARHLGQAVTAIQRGLKALSVDLKPADAAKLRQAGVLATQLQDMESSQDALSVLITVWNMTAPAERGPTFRKVSPELYDFLASKSDSELDCLARRHCPNPALGIAKLVIFPKLEAFGIEKMRDQIDASARDSIVTTAREQTLKILPTMPLVVRDAVVKQTAPYFAVLAKVKADVAGFTRSHVQSWASEHFNQPLKGLETSSLVVSLRARDRIEVKPASPAGSVVTTGAETIGASLSLAQAFLPAASEDLGLKSALVEPIMKVLAVGGFRQGNGKPFASFLMPVDAAPTQIFRLNNLMKEPTTYAVPDSFQANELFQMDRVHARKNVSVAAQAELLKGLSRQIGFYRDWEQNTYDVSLGKILVEDVAPEIPKGVVKSSVLPKDVLFAMALGNAGAVLQNLILDLSPAFLVLDKGAILWGNHYKEIKGNKVSTVAGMVSIVDGKRDGVVHTADIARYVLALDEFMAATDGMENSTSSVLLAKSGDGQSTLLADLVEVRKKIGLLQMGLANYLVYVAAQPDGSLASAYRVTDHLEKADSARRLEDQTLAIRALLASAKRLDLPMFRWAALDVYFGLNKNFFDADRQFYVAELGASASTRPTSLGEVVQTLLAGDELAEFMPSDTRAQWDQLAKPWRKALQDL